MEKSLSQLHVVYPTKAKQKLQYVVQHHLIGFTKPYPSLDAARDAGETASAHIDIRYRIPNESFAIGITGFTPSSLKNYKDNKYLNKQTFQGIPKETTIPLSWLSVDKKWFEPDKKAEEDISLGEVGGGKNSWGYMEIIDKGFLYLGTNKNIMIELFLHGNKVQGRLVGRNLVIKERQIWLFQFPKDQTPYCKTKKGIEYWEKNLKPKGIKQEWLCGSLYNNIILDSINKRLNV